MTSYLKPGYSNTLYPFLLYFKILSDKFEKKNYPI